MVYLNCDIPDTDAGVFRDSRITKLVVGNGVTSIGRNSFFNSTQLSSVSLPFGLASIGSSAFEGCKVLTSIRIPASVRSISDYAFKNCSALTEVVVPEGVESIGEYAFEGLTNLQSAQLPSSIRSLGQQIFKNSTGTAYVKCNIPDAGWGSISSFYNSKFTEVVISEGVESIGKFAFHSCSSIARLSLPYSLRVIYDEAFYNCSGLEDVYCYAINVPNVGNNAFERSSFTSATLHVPSSAISDYSNATIWGENSNIVALSDEGGGDNPTPTGEFLGARRIFGDNLLKSLCYDDRYEDSRLTFHYDSDGFVTKIDNQYKTYTINYDDKITVSKSDGTKWTATLESHGYIGRLDYTDDKGNMESATFTYNDNEQLVSVDYGGGDVYTLTYTDGDITRVTNYRMSIDYKYENSSQSKIQNVGNVMELDNIFAVDMDEFHLLFYIGGLGKATKHLPISGTANGETTTGSWTLDDAGRATKATFNGHSITWDWDGNGGEGGDTPEDENCINGIYYSFSYNTAEVTYKDKNYNTYTGDVVIPSTVQYQGKTYTVTDINNMAFRNCQGLTSVTIPESITTILSHTFEGCSNLATVVLPENMLSIQSYAFTGCSSLSLLTIPKNVTYIGGYAFSGCNLLTSIVIPEKLTSISGRNPFYGCQNLSSITVEEGNTVYDSRNNCNAVIETAENVLVAGCKNTIIPADITGIGENAFCYCSGMTELYCYAKVVPATPSTAFSNSPISSSTLYVPASSLASYKAIAPWSQFGNIVGMDDGDDPTPAGEFLGAKHVFGDNLLKSATYDDKLFAYYYDSNGYATKMERTSSSKKTYTITYGDSIIVRKSDGTRWTATLESHGYIGCLDYTDEKGNAGYVKFTYNEDGQLTGVNYDDDEFFTLTYSDGDLTRCTYNRLSGYNRSWDYIYETASQSKMLNTGNIMEFDNIFAVDMDDFNMLYYIGALGKPTTHLPLATIISGTTMSGTWTIDDAGRATKAVIDGHTLTWDWDGNGGQGEESEQYESAVLTGSIIGQWSIVGGSYKRYENDVLVSQEGGVIPPPYDRIAFYENGAVEFLEYSSSNGTYHEDGNGTYSIVNNKFVYGSGDWDTFIITSFDGSNNMEVFFQFSENKGSVIVRKVYTATLQRETGGGNEQETQTDNILAFADNMKVRVGSEFLMPIQMTNADAITGVQFDLYLPEGMQICVDEYGDEMIDVSRTSIRRHSIASRTMSDGALRIVISSTQNATFEGNSGTILTLKLAPENTMEAGTYEVLLKNVILTDPAAKRYAAPDVRSYINVTRYTLGDVNNDGYIDVADLAGVVRFILENADDNLIFNAADMDGNGLVEINDYAALVNVILSQNTPNAVQQHRAKAIRKPVISLSDLCLDGNGEGELVVRLDNNIMQYTGFQFDLRLPEGIELIDEGAESIGSQHGAWTQMLSDGVCRVVCASLMNEELREGDVLRLQVKVTGTMDREPEVVADNVILSDVNASRHDVASARAFVNTDDATGIRDAWGRMENGRIIYNLAGQRVQKGKKGLYIMNGKKVVVK